ncbi:MAG: AraC family transcriptional regulator [Lachnospiraceae bacterium]|nr:AraC family transcriptional regulator [Lachnospiraceae bacterium]
MTKDLNHESVIQSFRQREHESAHLPYETQLKNFNLIKLGDFSAVDKLYATFTNSSSSHLSNDPLRNKQFLFIVCITMATRHAIEGGLLMEEAFNLSDLYIQKMDCCKSIPEVESLYRQAITSLVEGVRASASKSRYSPAVQLCLDYIHLHLHSPITTEDLCQAAGLSPSYLTSQFKKETSLTPSRYIRKEKISAASNLLKYSDYSYIDISNYLSFSSQSHFIQVFRKETGLTPRQYRDKYFRRNYTDLSQE